MTYFAVILQIGYPGRLDASKSIIGVSTDRQKCDDYVMKQTIMYSAAVIINDARRDHLRAWSEAYREAHPEPEIEYRPSVKPPRWESHVKITTEMRAERERIEAENEARRAEDYLPRKKWGEAYSAAYKAEDVKFLQTFYFTPEEIEELVETDWECNWYVETLKELP